MPIISDKPSIAALAIELMAKSPCSATEAATKAVRQFYRLTEDDGIFGGSDAAVCNGIHAHEDSDVFDKVVDGIVKEVGAIAGRKGPVEEALGWLGVHVEVGIGEVDYDSVKAAHDQLKEAVEKIKSRDKAMAAVGRSPHGSDYEFVMQTLGLV